MRDPVLILLRAEQSAINGKASIAEFLFRAAALLDPPRRLSYGRFLGTAGRSKSARNEIGFCIERARQQSSPQQRTAASIEMCWISLDEGKLWDARQAYQLAVAALLDSPEQNSTQWRTLLLLQNLCQDDPSGLNLRVCLEILRDLPWEDRARGLLRLCRHVIPSQLAELGQEISLLANIASPPVLWRVWDCLVARYCRHRCWQDAIFQCEAAADHATRRHQPSRQQRYTRLARQLRRALDRVGAEATWN